MMREIGSEFWRTKQDGSAELNSSPDSFCLLSGRTALDFILRDMKQDERYRHIKRFYLPTYCCEWMVIPFMENRAGIKFYPVYVEDGHLVQEYPDLGSEDGILVMTYFGFGQAEAGEELHKGEMHKAKLQNEKLRKAGAVIEDTTHSCFTGSRMEVQPDYSFSSLRKWMYLPGLATAKKHTGDFCLEEPEAVNHEYMEKREAAARAKQAFIEDARGEKEAYLKLYGEATAILDRDYKNYRADRESRSIFANMDTEKMADRRRRNAGILLEAVREMDGIRPLFGEIRENDCPLFLPVLAETETRRQLSRYLIENGIYCPQHWPLTGYHRFSSEKALGLYEMELSLVCDQRYGDEEMRQFAEVLKNFKRG